MEVRFLPLKLNLKPSIMQNYKHEAKTLKEATGVDGKKVALKAGTMLFESGDINSKFIEKLENTFDKRELAVMTSMFLHEIALKNKESRERPEIKVMSMDSEDIPPEVKEAIQDLIKDQVFKDMDEENPNSFDPECGCERCTANREKAIKAGEFTISQFKSHGDC